MMEDDVFEVELKKSGRDGKCERRHVESPVALAHTTSTISHRLGPDEKEKANVDSRYGVNVAVRTHETDVATDWQYNQHADLAHRMIPVFNQRFFSDPIPTPFLRFEKLRGGTLGTYNVTRNGCGAECEITLSTSAIREMQTVEWLAVLAHEALHAWQHLYGNAKTRKSGSWYHNKQFCSIAARIGIPTNAKGHYLGVKDPFLSILAEFGITPEMPLLTPVETEAVAALPSKYNKFHCGGKSHPVIRVPAGCKEFAARCDLCGGQYQRFELMR